VNLLCTVVMQCSLYTSVSQRNVISYYLEWMLSGLPPSISLFASFSPFCLSLFYSLS